MTTQDISTEQIVELIGRTELRAIGYNELFAKREGNVTTPDVGAQISSEFSLSHHVSKGNLGIQITADLITPFGPMKIVAAAEYTLDDGPEPSIDLVIAFANEVAVMAIFPYIRSGVADLSSRTFGESITLPTAQRGQISFDLPATAE